MTAPLTRQYWLREILHWTLLSVAIVAVIAVFQFGIGGWPSTIEVIHDLTLGFVVCFAISALACTFMPRVASLAQSYNPITRWIVLVSTMVACGVLGLSLAIALLYLPGVLPGRLLGVVFRENIVGVSTVTLIVGTGFTILGYTQSRLEATELSLQTQRLERERAEKLAAETRLASLSSRVQPHFLFNTLNSISALVREDPAQAERTIERLSSLLRSSLEGKELVPLTQELKLVNDYLEIQRTRLGERLRFSLSSTPEATGMVPPFAVQTLVENSVRHVGEKLPEGVAVQVNSRREGGALVVEVVDDGPGFDQGELKAGHGLDTVEGRLRALCGVGAALEFERAGRSMTVRLRIPLA